MHNCIFCNQASGPYEVCESCANRCLDCNKRLEHGGILCDKCRVGRENFMLAKLAEEALSEQPGQKTITRNISEGLVHPSRLRATIEKRRVIIELPSLWMDLKRGTPALERLNVLKEFVQAVETALKNPESAVYDSPESAGRE